MTLWKKKGDLAGNGETLLLLDKDYLTRELLGEILNLNGYRVITALNRKHARSILENTKPRVDLIITDIHYDGIGDLLTTALEPKQTPVVIFTREELPEKNPPTFVGITLLEKPFDMLEVFHAIKTSLRDKHSTDPTTSKQYC